ncbi:TRAM domain-containing protein [Saliphagus sp. GCM10025334]
MSVLEKFLSGWHFRTTRPTLTPGTEVDVFLSEFDADDTGVARIGDTVLYVEGASPGHVEKRVRVRVIDFDDSMSTGRGEYVETVGESSYTQ